MDCSSASNAAESGKWEDASISSSVSLVKQNATVNVFKVKKGKKDL
jgi:hypothetical protein